MTVGIDVFIVTLSPNKQGNILADELSVVQVMLELENSVDALITIEAGTIHDVTRFCAAKAKILFLSVSIAPSVEGFTSKGAPLIIRRKKSTYQLVSPIAVFIPSDIIRDAPQALVIAGVGDMLGKYTSLLDWRFGSFDGQNPFVL